MAGPSHLFNHNESIIQATKITRGPTTASIRESLKSLQDLDNRTYTAEDGFRLISHGVEAEAVGRYGAAIENFRSAAECLTCAADNEIDFYIRELLTSKSLEVLRWAEDLRHWRQSDQTSTPVPVRQSHGMAVHHIPTTRQSPWCVSSSGNNKQHKNPFRIFTNNASRSRVPTTHPTTRDNPFHQLHYTPIASRDPTSLVMKDGYELQCMSSTFDDDRRPPQLMIVITMYNESPRALRSTLRKCCENIVALRRLPGYEGTDAWKNIVICIVCDGRTKVKVETLSYLASIGLFNEEAMTIFSAGLKTQLHLFENTIVLPETSKETTKTLNNPPMQMIFALKEQNQGKLHSHHWFFNGFARQIQPQYTILLDVGTLPTAQAFYRLLSTMEVDLDVGGVCGEIVVDKPFANLLNGTIAAQHFEYKISNVLDKATESCYGFISVLPGAFSAYRYRAIVGPPLDAYFKSLTTPLSTLGPFLGNMYLAEDRILCFELLARKDAQWTMTYVKDARARVDVPTTLVDLLAQRRRWNNGTLFAQLYVLQNWMRIYRESSHSIGRKLALSIQYLVMVLQTALNWFMLGNFYLVCYFVLFRCLESSEWKEGLGLEPLSVVTSELVTSLKLVFHSCYACTLAIQVMFGLGNKPQHVPLVYTITPVFYKLVLSLISLCTILTLVNHLGLEEPTTLDNINNEGRRVSSVFNLWILTGLNILVYILAGVLHCEIHHLVLSFMQYMAYLPIMINILMVYSFCNLQDVSWGTRGLSFSRSYVSSSLTSVVVRARDLEYHNRSSLNHKSSSNPPTEARQRNNVITDKESDQRVYADLVHQQKQHELEAHISKDLADQTKRRFDLFRSTLLLVWLGSNGLAISLCISLISAEVYLISLFAVMAGLNVHRLIGSTCFLLYTLRQKLILRCPVLRRTKEDENPSDDDDGHQYPTPDSILEDPRTPPSMMMESGCASSSPYFNVLPAKDDEKQDEITSLGLKEEGHVYYTL